MQVLTPPATFAKRQVGPSLRQRPHVTDRKWLATSLPKLVFEREEEKGVMQQKSPNQKFVNVATST